MSDPQLQGCERHGRADCEDCFMDAIESMSEPMLPRSVAENLAAVIQGAHDGYLGVDDLANALAGYRRAYPESEAP